MVDQHSVNELVCWAERLLASAHAWTALGVCACMDGAGSLRMHAWSLCMHAHIGWCLGLARTVYIHRI
jgi:pyruvate-formate lyase-activating enzyme